MKTKRMKFGERKNRAISRFMFLTLFVLTVKVSVAFMFVVVWRVFSFGGGGGCSMYIVKHLDN